MVIVVVSAPVVQALNACAKIGTQHTHKKPRLSYFINHIQKNSCLRRAGQTMGPLMKTVSQRGIQAVSHVQSRHSGLISQMVKGKTAKADVVGRQPYIQPVRQPTNKTKMLIINQMRENTRSNIEPYLPWTW